MTKSNIQNALLKAAITFVALYIPLHLVCVTYRFGNVALPVVVSILCGVLTSFVFKLLKTKAENYWVDISVFVLVFGIILGVSAALFYAHIEQGTFMWQVFYYFPQMVAVAFMIPGAAVFWLLRRLKYPKHETKNPIFRHKELNQMTKSNMQNALLKAVITFAVLYLLPHLLFVELRCNDELTIAVSILGGVLTSFVFKQLKIKAENYWVDVSAFVLVYGIILALSAALFYAHIEQGTFMWQMFYYFPQMLAVAFMIPGAVVHWLLVRSKYTESKRALHGIVRG